MKSMFFVAFCLLSTVCSAGCLEDCFKKYTEGLRECDKIADAKAKQECKSKKYEGYKLCIKGCGITGASGEFDLPPIPFHEELPKE